MEYINIRIIWLIKNKEESEKIKDECDTKLSI